MQAEPEPGHRWVFKYKFLGELVPILSDDALQVCSGAGCPAVPALVLTGPACSQLTYTSAVQMSWAVSLKPATLSEDSNSL